MRTVTSIYSEKLDLSYLAKYLLTNHIIMRPNTMAYMNALWSTLDPPEQANLLSGIKRLSLSIVQPHEDFIVTLKALKELLLELEIITSSESQSYKHLALNLAKKEFWKEAWDIRQLENDEDSKLTMLEWMSRTKIKLQQVKKVAH